MRSLFIGLVMAVGAAAPAGAQIVQPRSYGPVAAANPFLPDARAPRCRDAVRTCAPGSPARAPGAPDQSFPPPASSCCSGAEALLSWM